MIKIKIQFRDKEGDVAIGIYAQRMHKGEILEVSEEIGRHLLKHNKDFKLIETKPKKIKVDLEENK